MKHVNMLTTIAAWVCLVTVLQIPAMGNSLRDSDTLNGEIDLLVIVPEKWGANTFFNMDDTMRQGWNVTFAGLSDTVPPCYSFWYYTGVEDFTVDMLLTDAIDPADYDAVIIGPATSRTGPNPYGTLLDSPETLSLLQNAVNNDTFVWCTCAGLRVFAAADIINGRDVVGNDRFTDEYAAAGANWLGDDHPPVKDGPVLSTVRGMYYHHHLNEFIARAVEQSGAAGTGLQERGLLPVTETDLNWPETEWAGAIGTGAAEDVRDICTVDDDGYILAGFTWIEQMCDALLIRVDPGGTVRWARTFGGDGTEYGNSVCRTPDGGFLMAGFTTSTTADGNRDILLVCTDAGGNELWTRTHGGTGLDVAHCIRPVRSGGYILCGRTESSGNGEDDILVMRLGAAGEAVWSRTFGGTRAEVGRTVFELPNGDFMVAGANGSDDTMSHGNMDYYLIRLDNQGNEIWWQTYGNDTGEGFDFCYHAVPTVDGGFVMTGSSDATFPLDAVQIKADNSGNRLWFAAEGGDFYEYGTSVLETIDGTVVTAMTRTADDWDNDCLILRQDTAGTTQWSTTFGGDGHEWINASCMGPGGSIVIAGQTSSAGAGKSDVLIARIALDGNDTPAAAIRMPATMFTAGDTFRMDVDVWNPSPVTRTDVPLFVILDVYGELLFWPGWSKVVDYATITVPPGASRISILPEFMWPADAGAADGIGI